MSGTILVVEDEPKLRELLRARLESAGFTVLTTGSGAGALELAASARPDLVVLDLGLPDITGETVARELRSAGGVPIVMLTARADEHARVRGLELGADDYITKPFSPRELVLRVQAVLRRARPEPEPAGPARFGDGELELDEPRRVAHVRGHPADLTATEWGVLVALVEARGRVLSRLELINRVRGYEFSGYERTVDSHVKNLRKKIERDPSRPRIVVTVVGAGYRFDLRRDG